MNEHLEARALDVERLRRSCSTLTIGSDLHYLPSVDSTNRVARELGAGDWRHGTVVISDYQAAGRGRAGRIWTAPPRSSLLLSVILLPPRDVPSSYPVMLAALSVADAIFETTGLVAHLKWPNDVLVADKKVCGILAEHTRVEDLDRAIVGIGLNVNFDPHHVTDVPSTATSLMAAQGQAVGREALAEGLFNRLDMWYRCLTQQPEVVFTTWAARLDTIGRSVLVVDASGSWKGIATKVLPDGGLVVQEDMGALKTVYAADVSIRNPGDYAGP